MEEIDRLNDIISDLKRCLKKKEDYIDYIDLLQKKSSENDQ